jgi:hypothetical protein
MIQILMNEGYFVRVDVAPYSPEGSLYLRVLDRFFCAICKSLSQRNNECSGRDGRRYGRRQCRREVLAYPIALTDCNQSSATFANESSTFVAP